MKPILPTEGVAVGTIIPNTLDTDWDPTTGIEVSVIKTGKYDADEEIDGCPKPDNLGSTPALTTPISK